MSPGSNAENILRNNADSPVSLPVYAANAVSTTIAVPNDKTTQTRMIGKPQPGCEFSCWGKRTRFFAVSGMRFPCGEAKGDDSTDGGGAGAGLVVGKRLK